MPQKSHYLMQFFKSDGLPDNQRRTSQAFGELARAIDSTLPSNPEKTTALRKLLEARTCAIQAIIFE